MGTTASDVVERTRQQQDRPPEAARPTDNPRDLESVGQALRTLRTYRATITRRYQAGGGVAERAKLQQAQRDAEAAR